MLPGDQLSAALIRTKVHKITQLSVIKLNFERSFLKIRLTSRVHPCNSPGCIKTFHHIAIIDLTYLPRIR